MTMMRYFALVATALLWTFDSEGGVVVKDSDGFASEISPFAFEQLGVCVLQLRGPMLQS